MNLDTYQQNALRTEAKITHVHTNARLVPLLETFVSITEILDAYKKSIYYSDDSKLEKHFNKNIIDDKSAIDIDPRILHGIIGISTEAGELVEALLSAIKGSKNIDSVNISEEMHDISWYMAVLHDALGLSWEDGLTNNIDKLKIRFPDKFDNWSAKNRNISSERKALEGTK